MPVTEAGKRAIAKALYPPPTLKERLFTWLCGLLGIDIQQEKSRNITDKVMAELKIAGNLTVVDFKGKSK